MGTCHLDIPRVILKHKTFCLTTLLEFSDRTDDVAPNIMKSHDPWPFAGPPPHWSRMLHPPPCVRPASAADDPAWNPGEDPSTPRPLPRVLKTSANHQINRNYYRTVVFILCLSLFIGQHRRFKSNTVVPFIRIQWPNLLRKRPNALLLPRYLAELSVKKFKNLRSLPRLRTQMTPTFSWASLEILILLPQPAQDLLLALDRLHRFVQDLLLTLNRLPRFVQDLLRALNWRLQFVRDLRPNLVNRQLVRSLPIALKLLLIISTLLPSLNRR